MHGSGTNKARLQQTGCIPSVSWPGVAKPIDQYGPVGGTSSDSKSDDGDFDLFGSDSEEEVR